MWWVLRETWETTALPSVSPLPELTVVPVEVSSRWTLLGRMALSNPAQVVTPFAAAKECT